MKYIRKKSEPKALLDLKAFESEDWKPSWSDLYGEAKKFVVGYLKSDLEGRFSEFWTTIQQLFSESRAA